MIRVSLLFLNNTPKLLGVIWVVLCVIGCSDTHDTPASRYSGNKLLFTLHTSRCNSRKWHVVSSVRCGRRCITVWKVFPRYIDSRHRQHLIVFSSWSKAGTASASCFSKAPFSNSQSIVWHVFCPSACRCRYISLQPSAEKWCMYIYYTCSLLTG